MTVCHIVCIDWDIERTDFLNEATVLDEFEK